jgi:two-component system cell cycle sensor histidine kinase/response regulator CckA
METILLVENKNSARERFASALAGRGYSVFTAADGIEAVEHFRSFAKYVDLVIIDHGIPRMSGFEAAVTMREISPEVKVILLAGDSASDMTDEMRECGINEILVKPFTMKSAMKCIRTVLEKAAN